MLALIGCMSFCGAIRLLSWRIASFKKRIGLITQARVNGVEIEYETWGVRSGRPLLLVGGRGTQILTWPEPLIPALVDASFFINALKNRDIALSTKFGDWGSADIKVAFK